MSFWPAAAWIEAPEWRGLVRLARLDGLDDAIAEALLMSLGVAEPDRAELVLRRWLSRADGERPSPVQAALWLDIKRHYLALRPRLRRVYLTVADPAPYAATAARLGMEMLPDWPLIMGGTTWHGVLLDMGPASVDGWLARLAGDELDTAEGGLLDIRTRTLRLGKRRVPLTQREFELLGVLIARAGACVSRDELLDELWGRSAGIGSNVVDALVAGLRRKLGDRADVLETVRGHGYRYREPGAEAEGR